MYKKQLFYFLLLICTFIAFAQSPKARVFILAGQSNMVGTGNIMDLSPEQKAPQSNVYIYNAGTGSNPWMILEPGTGAYKGSFGPEVTFASEMSRAYPGETLYIIKIAWIGTSLAYDWLSPSPKNAPGPLYVSFMENMETALNTLGKPAEIMGMCWMQGESDATNIYPASDYEANLRAFIKDVRSDLGYPSLPFVIAMIDDTPTWQEFAIVRQAQQDVAASTENVGIFDTADYETDGSHYHSAGLLEMGEDFASTLKAMLGSQPTPEALLGDVNNDEQINILDALLIARYYIGQKPEVFLTLNADVNCDSEVNIVDALLVAQYYVALIHSFCD